MGYPGPSSLSSLFMFLFYILTNVDGGWGGSGLTGRPLQSDCSGGSFCERKVGKLKGRKL